MLLFSIVAAYVVVQSETEFFSRHLFVAPRKMFALFQFDLRSRSRLI